MSAPEIAQLKRRTLNSPLTERQRAKNSPFHREVMPAYREGSAGVTGLLMAANPAATSWAGAPGPSRPSCRSALHSLRPSRRGRSWLVYSRRPFSHSQLSPTLPRPPRASSLLPPLRPSPPSTEKTEGEAIR